MTRPVSSCGVVILPPPSLRREVEDLRRELTRFAQRKPPHITVKAPFLFRSTGAVVVEILEAVCSRFEPFDIELRGFGSFGTEVVYVQVEESPRLRELHLAIRSELVGYVEDLQDGRYEGGSYLPHLTVAEKLSAEEFARARKVLGGAFVRQRFPVEQLHLLQGQSQWKVTRAIPLGHV